MAEQIVHGNIPIPDPSTLTTEQLRRELQSLREFLMKDMQRIEEVHVEKFKGIDVRFSENKTALDAALRAQKDAVDSQNKSNSEATEKQATTFTKQIDGLQKSINDSASATGDRITDLKGRLDRGEGSTSGVSSTVATGISVFALLVAIVMLGVVIAENSGHSTPVAISAPK